MENFALIVPGLIAFGEVLKRIFGFRSKWVPSMLLVTGIVIAFSLDGVNALALLGGVIAVATALGLYSGYKATAEAFSVGGKQAVNRNKK